MNLPLGGIRIIESPFLTTEEVDIYPERSWRRFYRTHKVERVIYPKPDLYVVGSTAYGHPMAVRRLKTVIEAGVTEETMPMLLQKPYPPVRVESRYVYDWTWLAWIIVFFTLAAWVVWGL